MRKVHIVYEVGGTTKNKIISGEMVSVTIAKNRSAVIDTYDEKGRVVRTFMVTRLYYADIEVTYVDN